MSSSTDIRTIEKQYPVSQGKTNLRKRKPKQLAVINECCTGCSGSPACVEYCPVEACMFWIPDEDHPPFGRIEVDKVLCIGCARCTSKGPEGAFLDGCPWDAIDMVDTGQWEAEHGIELPDVPEKPPEEWMTVAEQHV
jgi:ferredoxin